MNSGGVVWSVTGPQSELESLQKMLVESEEPAFEPLRGEYCKMRFEDETLVASFSFRGDDDLVAAYKAAVAFPALEFCVQREVELLTIDHHRFKGEEELSFKRVHAIWMKLAMAAISVSAIRDRERFEHDYVTHLDGPPEHGAEPVFDALAAHRPSATSAAKYATGELEWFDWEGVDNFEKVRSLSARYPRVEISARSEQADDNWHVKRIEKSYLGGVEITRVFNEVKSDRRNDGERSSSRFAGR